MKPSSAFRVTLLRLAFLPSLILLLGSAVLLWVFLRQTQVGNQALSSRAASLLAARVNDRLRERAQFLDQLARTMEIVPQDRRFEVFQTWSEQQKDFEGLYLLDPGLLVRAEWSTGGRQVKNVFSGLETLHRFGLDNKVVWSDRTFPQSMEKATVSLVRVFDGGIVLGDLDLEPLVGSVVRFSGLANDSVLLLDSQGRYLTHPGSKEADQRAADPLYLSQREANPKVSSYLEQRNSGLFEVFVQPVPETGWVALVSDPRAAFDESLTPVLFLLVPLTALFTAGTLLLVHLTHRSLRRSLDILKRLAERVGRGDFGDGEVRTRYRDFNAILESFDTMRQAIWLRERDLRMGESRFRKMFEDAAIGIFHSTYTGELLDLNLAMAELLGYRNPQEAKEALGGSTLGIYVRPEEREAMVRMLQSTADTKINVTTEFFHRSGVVLSVNHHLARVFDAKTDQFLLEAFTEDITELKRAEQAVLDLNQALEAKVLERTSHLAKAMEDLETAQTHLVQSEKMAALGQLIAGIAHELNTPLAAIHASNDNIASLLPKVLIDLPALLQVLPPGLNVLYRRLYEIAARNIDVVPSAVFRTRRKEVLKAMAARGLDLEAQVVASLVELGASDSLDDWLPLVQSPYAAAAIKIADEMVSLEKSCSVIASASEKAAQVINALRTFSHQAQEAVFERVNVGHGMETVLTLFQSRFREGVAVHTDLDPSAQVWGLGDKLNQVWTNLVANALHAMGDRGQLEIMVQGRTPSVRVSVIDSGPGVSESVRGRIFEPFFTTKKAGDGIGMGLDICRRIVEEHGGKIGFESRPGRTEFYVELPEAR